MSPKKMLKMLFIFTMVAAFLTGCAQLLDLLNKSKMKKPSVNVTDVNLAGLSFDKADLIFTLSVDNPNNLSINLTGFNYDLFLNKKNESVDNNS